jgi:hypothetical protein
VACYFRKYAHENGDFEKPSAKADKTAKRKALVQANNPEKNVKLHAAQDLMNTWTSLCYPALVYTTMFRASSAQPALSPMQWLPRAANNTYRRAICM